MRLTVLAQFSVLEQSRDRHMNRERTAAFPAVFSAADCTSELPGDLLGAMAPHLCSECLGLGLGIYLFQEAPLRIQIHTQLRFYFLCWCMYLLVYICIVRILPGEVRQQTIHVYNQQKRLLSRD